MTDSNVTNSNVTDSNVTNSNVTDSNNAGVNGVTLTLTKNGVAAGTVQTAGLGSYSFANLAAGANYVVTPGGSFTPSSQAFSNLASNAVANFKAAPSIPSQCSNANFALAAKISVGSNPQTVAAADFNGDGKLDLTVANRGSNTVSVYRFTQESIVVNVGDTVEWTNVDPVTAHTVTFGTEPTGSLTPPSAGVAVDTDGARHAALASPTDSVHSGILVAAPQDRVGLAQANLGVTRFRVTFTAPGAFRYICALHDNEGMVGTVLVRP